MKSIVQLLHQYLMPFNGWPWLHYVGLALLPVVFLTGFAYPRVAFGLAVWDFVILLAIPFMLTPKVLRALICNRRLVLVPGFATTAVLTALLYTLLVSSFLGFFAWLFEIPGLGLRNTAELFVVSSIYVVVMQYAVTTAGAIVALSLLPLTCIAAILFTMQSTQQMLVSDSQLVVVTAVSLLGWLVAILRTRGVHQFKREHASMENYKISGYQRAPVGSWLLQGSDALANPDATLLLGYPATLTTRLRVMVYMVFIGPTIGTIFLSVMNFSAHLPWHPSALEIFIGASLFPAAFTAFQNIEWVTRLRLLWLRRPVLRNGLWQFLEKQMVINLLLLMLPCSVLMLCGLLFSQLPASLLLHYPVLILVFNGIYGYYTVCARTSAWPALSGLMACIIGSCCIFGGLWAAIVWHDSNALFGVEALTIVGAIKFRMMARQKLQSLDWLMVRPCLKGHAI